MWAPMSGVIEVAYWAEGPYLQLLSPICLVSLVLILFSVIQGDIGSELDTVRLSAVR